MPLFAKNSKKKKIVDTFLFTDGKKFFLRKEKGCLFVVPAS